MKLSVIGIALMLLGGCTISQEYFHDTSNDLKNSAHSTVQKFSELKKKNLRKKRADVDKKNLASFCQWIMQESKTRAELKAYWYVNTKEAWCTDSNLSHRACQKYKDEAFARALKCF